MTSKKDMFGDDLEVTRSEFENLFDRISPGKLPEVQVGTTIRGEILVIGKDEVFVSTGTPKDGIIPKSALLDKDKQFKYKVGDIVEAMVLKVRSDSILLGKKNTGASGIVDDLQDAFDMELPVEGRVLEAVKGGFRVDVMGARAFCPLSQMDLAYIKEPEPYVGKTFEFIITQLEERNVVVSRRKVLELQRAENEGEFLQSVRAGDTVEGKVVRLESFGAFVELQPGIEGLIHVSEISWSRIRHPEEVLSVGTQVRVKVLKIDSEGERLKIALSLKEGGSELDPWFGLDTKISVGQVFTGTIEKKEAYGFFVQILPGVTGLLPKSSFRDHPEAASFDSKKKGDTLQVQVAQINMPERRMSLAPPSDQPDDSWKTHAPQKQGLGTFGDLLKKTQMNKK